MTSLAFSGRRVHFEGLNWDEEDQRSQKGAERRREHKKQKRLSRLAARLAANENERGRREAFRVLLQEDLRPRILAACDNRSLHVNLTLLLTEDGVGPHDGDLARRLRAFQIDRNDYMRRYDELNETGRECLSMIRNHPAFVSAFFSPPGHVSDSSYGENSLADRLEAEMLEAQQQQDAGGGGPDDALAAEDDDHDDEDEPAEKPPENQVPEAAIAPRARVVNRRRKPISVPGPPRKRPLSSGVGHL